MLRLKYQTIITASPEEVFQHVTGYPSHGQIDGPTLADRYGAFLSGEAPAFSFQQEISGSSVIWECRFDPPRQREMRAVESSWSDRIDRFVPTPRGTLWQITWEVKSSGTAALLKWLAFQLAGKRNVERRLIQPVLQQIHKNKTPPP